MNMKVEGPIHVVCQCDKCKAQPEQEPVAWKETDEIECPVCKNKGFPWPKCGHITYLERTSPPQRKPLMDEEIEKMRHLIDWTAAWSYINFARAIEAAHGVKE